jgi:Cysteine-rich CPXCG
MLPAESIECPYCGESIEIVIDDSVECQQYIEDCWVCCRPINIEVSVDAESGISVTCQSEDEV